MNVKLRAFTYLIEDEKKECITQSNLDELLEKEKLNNSFSLKKALLFCSKMAGICYMRENFDTILKEKEENTLRRLNRVLTSGHHSVFDHFYLTFEISDIPKILAMILCLKILISSHSLPGKGSGYSRHTAGFFSLQIR